MLEKLHSTTPIAKKEHICCFCTGLIDVGEKYNRDTMIYDGRIYDWLSHKHCMDLIRILNIEPYDEGIDQFSFSEAIDDYVYRNHYDEDTDDIAPEWQGKTTHELVEMIWNENNDKIRQ